MTTFVALGDSVTAGIGDPLPDGRWRGWAELLAGALLAPSYVNLASSGAMVADVRRVQLPRALELRPDLASVVVGINDTLRRTFDPDRLAVGAEHTIGALREHGAVVLTMRLPDPGRMFGLPGSLARPLGRRIAAVNAAMSVLAARYGTVHFDAASHPDTYDSRMWSVDRLHPSERGHRMIAGAYHDLLASARFELGPRPDPEPHAPAPTRLAQLGWLATHGTGWVLRRSTDLVPHLVAMAAREWWTGSREWWTASRASGSARHREASGGTTTPFHPAGTDPIG